MNKNPYLHEVSFEKVINLNLPQYDNLNYNGGAIYLNSGGIKGLILVIKFLLGKQAVQINILHLAQL